MVRTRVRTVAQGSAWGGTSAVGIAEVAARAGVSPATVSRALRGLTGVSAEKQRAVQAAAAELGYVASASASALALGRTSAVGVLAPWISRWFFTAVIEGAQDLLSGRGYDVMLYPLGANAGPDAPAVRTRTLAKKVDGVLALNVPGGVGAAALADLPLPVVSVGSGIPGVSGVSVDDEAVGHLATRHLIELGHRRIAFLGLDPDRRYGFTVASDRHLGYLRALRESALPIGPHLTSLTGFSVQAGEAALEHQLMLAGWDPGALPTGIVAVSDEVAMGIVYAARERGIRVPEDLSVIGVDDHDLAYLFGMTTIGQPVREQGRIAADLLLAQMLDPGCPMQTIKVPAGLIERKTTAPPRTDRKR